MPSAEFCRHSSFLSGRQSLNITTNLAPLTKLSCTACSLRTSFEPSLHWDSGNGKYATEDDRMHKFMHCVLNCSRGRERRSEFFPFVVESEIVGYIHPGFAEHLREFPDVFCIGNDKTAKVELHQDLVTPEQRTAAVESVLLVLRGHGLVPGWRNERYPVVVEFDSPAFFSLERAAVPLFGTKEYATQMNGYVDLNGEKRLWVAKRSRNKSTYPGYLDNLVSGGQPVGLSCQANLIKECEEEAGIPKAIANKAFPVGVVTFEDVHENLYKRSVSFCYDLQLPLKFQPYNKDGEVESFHLFPIDRVMDNLDKYKPDCALGVMEFLFRHGYVKPEQKGYLQLWRHLRRVRGRSL